MLLVCYPPSQSTCWYFSSSKACILKGGQSYLQRGSEALKKHCCCFNTSIPPSLPTRTHSAVALSIGGAVDGLADVAAPGVHLLLGHAVRYLASKIAYSVSTTGCTIILAQSACFYCLFLPIGKGLLFPQGRLSETIRSPIPNPQGRHSETIRSPIPNPQ